MSLTPDGRRRMIRDFEKNFKYAKQPQEPDWIKRIEAFSKQVEGYAMQIAKAGGAVKEQDRQALRETVFTMLLQLFDSLDYEDLHFFSVTIVADRIMQEIESRPWGGDKPDLLS